MNLPLSSGLSTSQAGPVHPTGKYSPVQKLPHPACLRGGNGGSDISHRFPSQMAQLRFLLQKSQDRKSTRLNSSHVSISYAVFCLKKKNVIACSKCNINI